VGTDCSGITTPQCQGEVYVLKNFMSISPACRQIFVDILINKKPMLGLIDTGSGVTIADISVIGNNREKIIPVNKTVVAANGQRLNLLGKVAIELDMGTLNKNCDILIATDLPQGTLILGNDLFFDMNLKIDYNNKTVQISDHEPLHFFDSNNRKYDLVEGEMKRDPYEVYYINVLTTEELNKNALANACDTISVNKSVQTEALHSQHSCGSDTWSILSLNPAQLHQDLEWRMPAERGGGEYVGPESVRKGLQMLNVANPNRNDGGRGHSDRWHSDIAVGLPYSEEVSNAIEVLSEMKSLNSLPGSQESVAVVSNDVCIPPNTAQWVGLDLSFLKGDFVFIPCKKAEVKYGIQIDEALVDAVTDGLFVQNHTDNTVSIQKGMKLGKVVPVDVSEEHAMIATLADGSDKDAVQEIEFSDFDINPQAGRSDIKEIKQIIWEYRDVFAKDNSELGHTHLIEHSIDTGNNPPVRQKLWGRFSEEEHQLIAKQVQEMLDHGVITRGNSPWCANVVLAPKKGTTALRFCTDYRQLNNVTVSRSYPIPRIDEILDSMRSSKVFTHS
jgi:hypothetical protein